MIFSVSHTGRFVSRESLTPYIYRKFLCRLQNYLCDRLDAERGTITVHSGSLHIRKKSNEHLLAGQIYEDNLRQHKDWVDTRSSDSPIHDDMYNR